MMWQKDTDRSWWQQPLRVIQTNMQVKDTGLINPQKLASQIKELGANVLVFNTGGIYAWYPSRVRFHTVNNHLPAHTDLLKDLIQACHDQELRFIARFDFSKAEDDIYLQRPEWFVRKEEGLPDIIGAARPGPWPLLLSTCINGGYRNEEVAIPVLQEVLSRYEIDGIFFNAPGYVFCRCEGCQRKYADLYGKELPRVSADLEKDFAARCFDDNMENMYRTIKAEREEVPMVLYYNLHRDHLGKRVEMTDMLCTEPQDVLSLGHHRIPEFWMPALSIKVGRSVPGRPAPFGIVHSCPGMDWRHTGLPTAEYRFWLAQVPANGGQIWHSLTGIPDTITDKRILRTVAELNRNTAKLADYMDGAVPVAQIALLWNAGRAAEGWAEALINKQIPFNVLLPESVGDWRLEQYKAVLIPDETHYTPEVLTALEEYVGAGGCMIAEGTLTSELKTVTGGARPAETSRETPGHAVCEGPHEMSTTQRLHRLLGVRDDLYNSENLTASYLRFCGEENPLWSDMEDTELIPHRGRVTYCKPLSDDVRVLATLVPPFSPLESVGAPPERASLAVKETDLPLAMEHKWRRGRVLYFPFSLSALMNEFKLAEHDQLLANAVSYAVMRRPLVSVTSCPGLQVTLFRKDNQLLLHLVNGAGRRPLAATLPLHQIEVAVRLEGASVSCNVEQLIAGETLEGALENGVLTFTVPRLEVWECLCIPFATAHPLNFGL